jgi:uncharacterized protein YkwD
MPETAQPLFLLHRKRTLLVPNKTKLLLVFFIFVLSYLSGKVTVLNDMARTGQALPSMGKDISSVLPAKTHADFSTKSSIDADVEQATQIQIKQVAIGQKAVIVSAPVLAPTTTPGNAWGVAKKIDTHTYTMQVQPDSRTGTAQEIFAALNAYRQQQGKGTLAWDEALANFANTRAGFFSQKGTLDNHAGFLDYLNNQDGFKKLGFGSVGENSSFGFTLEAVHLIEWVYAGDSEHNDNQLSSDWHYVGISVNGTSTDLVFAGNKL